MWLPCMPSPGEDASTPSSMCHGEPVWPLTLNCTVSPSPDEPTSKFVRTLGTWFKKAWNPSRDVGSASNCSRVSSVDVAVDDTSTSGDEPETVIVSAKSPTD